LRGYEALKSEKRKKQKDKSKKHIKEELQDLCQLIMWLDGLTVFKRVEPSKIESAFKSLGSKWFGEWKSIRRYVEKIVYMPMDIPEVSKLMTIVYYVKTMIPLTSMLVIISFMSLAYKSVWVPHPILKNPIFLLFTLILFTVFVNTFIILDYRIRSKIEKYEKAHTGKLSRGREQIKKVAQKLIFKLVKDIKRYDEDPEDYKMELFHKDYKGVKIIKEKKTVAGIFPRSHIAYVAVPLASK